MYGPYRLVYMAVYGPCARPFSAVYTSPCTLPFSAVYIARTRPCNGPCTWPLHGRVQGPSGPCIRQVGLPGRVRVPRRHATPCAAHYGIRSVYVAVYTARVDKHVYGSVWDVYTTVYMARYGRVHGPRPQRAVLAHVHGRAGLPAVYTDVYMARTPPFNCGVDVCTCRTAV